VYISEKIHQTHYPEFVNAFAFGRLSENAAMDPNVYVLMRAHHLRFFIHCFLLSSSSMSKQINFSKPGEINPDKVKAAVFAQVDFPLHEQQWLAVEEAFAHVWNVEIGIRGAFYNDQIVKSVFQKLKKDHYLIEFERVESIVNIILDYVEHNGGLLDDERQDSTKLVPDAKLANKPSFQITYGDDTSEVFIGSFKDAFNHAQSKSLKFSVVPM